MSIVFKQIKTIDGDALEIVDLEKGEVLETIYEQNQAKRLIFQLLKFLKMPHEDLNVKAYIASKFIDQVKPTKDSEFKRCFELADRFIENII